MAKTPGPLAAAVVTAVSAGSSAAVTATENPYRTVCPGRGVTGWPGGADGLPERGTEEVITVMSTGETAAEVSVTGAPVLP